MKRVKFEATVRLNNPLLEIGQINSKKLFEFVGKDVVVIVRESEGGSK